MAEVEAHNARVAAGRKPKAPQQTLCACEITSGHKCVRCKNGEHEFCDAGKCGQGKQAGAVALKPKTAPAADRERDIHDAIEYELNRRRWYYVHSRTDKPTTQRAGVPDFIIALPDGNSLWVEVKKKGGKLSAEQNITRHILLSLGHRFALVFSMDDFLEAISSINKPVDCLTSARCAGDAGENASRTARKSGK